MKTLFPIILIGFSVVNAFGQMPERKVSLGLGGGIDLISNRDYASSPLAYQGFGLPIGINALVMSKRRINRFEGTFILPLLTNNYVLKSYAKTQLKDWSKVKLSYQLLQNVGGNSSNYLGGEIKIDYFYREYHFLDGFGWEMQNSLNFSYARLITINPRSFILPQIAVPIIAFIHRKPSLTLDEAFLNDLENNKRKEILNYGSWDLVFNRWSAFELKILYHHQLNERFSFESQLGLNFYSISFPEKVKNINIPVLCYINYHL